MKTETPFKKTRGKGLAVFYLSIFVCLFWLLGSYTHAYGFVMSGVFFEILWFPMIASLFGLPIICFIFWAKQKFIRKSFFLYALIIGIVTIGLLVFGRE